MDNVEEKLNEIHALCELMAARGWPITPVRALEVLIWMETEPSGEYRGEEN